MANLYEKCGSLVTDVVVSDCRKTSHVAGHRMIHCELIGFHIYMSEGCYAAAGPDSMRICTYILYIWLRNLDVGPDYKID